jgi:hypothetical protein
MYSAEQLEIIKKINDPVNISVCAVPGAGKSTTIYGIAKYHPKLKILVLNLEFNESKNKEALFRDLKLKRSRSILKLNIDM